MTLKTFKVELPTEHELRKSLTMKPSRSMRQLMDYIDEHNGLRKIRPNGKARPKPSQRRGIISRGVSKPTHEGFTEDCRTLRDHLVKGREVETVFCINLLGRQDKPKLGTKEILLLS